MNFLNEDEVIMPTSEILQCELDFRTTVANIHLNTVDTPGFGSFIDNQSSLNMVADYIDGRLGRIFIFQN